MAITHVLGSEESVSQRSLKNPSLLDRLLRGDFPNGLAGLSPTLQEVIQEKRDRIEAYRLLLWNEETSLDVLLRLHGIDP